MKTAKEMREITNAKIEEIAKLRFAEAEKTVEEEIAPIIEEKARDGKERYTFTGTSALHKDIALILKQYGYTVQKPDNKTLVISW